MPMVLLFPVFERLLIWGRESRPIWSEMAVKRNFDSAVLCFFLCFIFCVSVLSHCALADEFTNPSNDNIDDHEIAESPNLCLIIRSPEGLDDTTNITGFLDGQLQSRGFVIDSADESNTSSSSAVPSSSSFSSKSLSSSVSSSTFSTLSAAIATSAATRTVAISSTTAPHASAATKSHGLSTGAEAGIGAGAALGGLLLFGLGIMAGIRWMKRRKKAQAQAQDAAGVGPGGSPDKEIYNQEKKPEGDSHSIRVVPELPSTSHPRGNRTTSRAWWAWRLILRE